MFQAGQTVGDYEIRRIISDDGSYGTVFLAKSSKDGVEVALKQLRDSGEDATKRFELENEMLHKLKVCRYTIDPVTGVVTESPEQPYYCMELAEGDLDTYFSRPRESNELLLNFFKNVCEGVKFAHDAGIIHRDLYTNNILIKTVKGVLVPKLTDFGMAKDFTGVSWSRIDGAIWGALESRSPEVRFHVWGVADQEKYILNDIYSLGRIFSMIMGETLIMYDAVLKNSISNFISVNGLGAGISLSLPISLPINERKAHYETWSKYYIDEHNEANLIIHLAEPNPKLENEINSIIRKCCDADYNKRYQTVDEIIAEVGSL